MEPAIVTRGLRLAGHCVAHDGQRGVVVLVALVAMVLVSLAAVAMINAMDTTNLSVGNLAFRQAAILPANMAVEQAAAALFKDANNGTAMIPDTKADASDYNYFSTYDSQFDNKFGIPTELQKKSSARTLKVQLKDDANNEITYVIQRMCNPNAPNIPVDKSARGSWCDMMPPKQSPGTTVNDPALFPFPNVPFYRVTVRVDGPQNTTSFAQATLR